MNAEQYFMILLSLKRDESLFSIDGKLATLQNT